MSLNTIKVDLREDMLTLGIMVNLVSMIRHVSMRVGIRFWMSYDFWYLLRLVDHCCGLCAFFFSVEATYVSQVRAVCFCSY